MAKIYGFFEYDQFVSNNVDVDNTIGEMPSIGKTYDRDNLVFNEGTHRLYVTKQDELVGSEVGSRDAVISAVMTELADLRTTIQVGGGTLADQVNAALNTDISILNIGPAIVNNITGDSWPSYISFEYTGNSGENWTFLVWLAGSIFVNDYSEPEYQVIHPVDIKDDLYDDFDASKLEVGSRTAGQEMSRVNALVAGATHSHIAAITLRVHRLSNVNEWFNATWYVIVNGPMPSTEEILGAIADDIVDGSNYTIEQWIEVIPGLVATNKYWVIPTWDNIAKDNPGLASPIYSPTVRPEDKTNLINSYFSTVADPSGTLDRLEYSVLNYNSIGFYIVPEEDNPNGWEKFSEDFADFANININSHLINLLDSKTIQAIRLLDSLIQISEDYISGTTTLDPEYDTVTRGDLTYITGTIVGAEFAVATRESYLASL